MTNTGLTEDEVQRQYDIGQAFFALPHQTKAQPQYKCDFSRGNYFGYRELGEKTIKGTDVRDNVESYNHAKFTPHHDHDHTSAPRHPFFIPYEPELAAFSRKAMGVASRVLELCALVLELPADFFASRHRYDDPSDDHLRHMMYRPRPADQDARVDDTWARAHTDFGSLTLLWSQDVAGLQIKAGPAGEWRYVPPVDGGIVCNIGDTLDFWSASYLKSTTHRVVRPPGDQLGGDRLGLFYFVRPGNDVDITPAPSPLLRRLGLVGERQDGAVPVKGLEYVRARVKDYHDGSDYGDRRGQKFKVGNLEIVDEAA